MIGHAEDGGSVHDGASPEEGSHYDDDGVSFVNKRARGLSPLDTSYTTLGDVAVSPASSTDSLTEHALCDDSPVAASVDGDGSTIFGTSSAMEALGNGQEKLLNGQKAKAMHVRA